MKLSKYLKINLLLFLLLNTVVLKAQLSWVYFKDKCNHQTDYFETPVCSQYINQVKETGIVVLGDSRWLNAICVEADNPDFLNTFPFVSAIEPLNSYQSKLTSIDEVYEYGKGDWQIEMLGLDSFHRKGFTGAGVTIAVFDAGFHNLDSIRYFDSLWTNKHLVAYFDFVEDKIMSFKESAHGMQVMALLASNKPDSLVGASPNSDYILARTEISGSETHKEEFLWLKAMEWADKNGADIIHSSLGYSLFDSLEGDYSYYDMDGSSTIITIAAELAASKGIFITNSAGNEGNDPWLYITAPCDGEHVLCIGAVDSFRQHAEFSSFGPSSDGRVKPNVMAMGVRNTILSDKGILRTGSGTSFSGPLIAGMVACLMQAHPQLTNEQIFEGILLSCDRYTNPDSAYGYGIPNVLVADSILKTFPILLDISENHKIQKVNVFPNPSSEYIKVSCEPGSSFQIIDINGKMVKEDQLINWVNFVNVNQIRSGTYWIIIDSQGYRQTKQIVIY